MGAKAIIGIRKGQWYAVREGRYVAFGDTEDEVIQKVEAYGYDWIRRGILEGEEGSSSYGKRD